MFGEQLLPAGDRRLNVAAGLPNGPAVVLFHGVGRCWQDFATLIPMIAPRAQVFAVDHRGHGRSPRAGRYLVADYIADGAAFVRNLSEPAVLIGHSLGALTALGVAAEVPDRVLGVVLEDPPSATFLSKIDGTAYAVQWRAMQKVAGSDRPLKDVAAELAEVALPGGLRMKDVRDAPALRFLARCLRDLDPAVLTPVLEKRWLEGFDPLAAASRVKCPTLLLAADTAAGGMLPPEDADAFEHALPDAIRMFLPKVGHHVRLMAYDQYLRILLNFLDSFPSRS